MDDAREAGLCTDVFGLSRPCREMGRCARCGTVSAPPEANRPSGWREIVRPFPVATDTTRAPFDLRDEHLASRKAWGAYNNLTTVVHRQTAAQADEFIAQLRTRLQQARPTGALGKMGRGGIEPPTLGLKVPCSTN
jgi:hypothetical protein